MPSKPFLLASHIYIYIMDILRKDCSTMVMGVWTVGVTYNCNISGSNQDIFTNEAPIDSGGFFALMWFIFYLYFITYLAFRMK